MDLCHYNYPSSLICHYYSSYWNRAITISKLSETCHYIPFQCVSQSLLTKIPPAFFLSPLSLSSLSTATNSSAEHHLGASAARATGRLRAFAGRLGVATPSSPAAIPTTNGEGEEGRRWREERGGGGGAPAPLRGPPLPGVDLAEPPWEAAWEERGGGDTGRRRCPGRREAHREARRHCWPATASRAAVAVPDHRPPPAKLELVPTRRRLPAATSPERRGGR